MADDVARARDVVVYIEDMCPYTYEAGDAENASCDDPEAVYESIHERWRRMKPSFDMKDCRVCLHNASHTRARL